MNLKITKNLSWQIFVRKKKLMPLYLQLLGMTMNQINKMEKVLKQLLNIGYGDFILWQKGKIIKMLIKEVGPSFVPIEWELKKKQINLLKIQFTWVVLAA